MITYLLGLILLIEAALMALPAAVALIFGENAMPFFLTMAILIAVSMPALIFKPKNRRIFAKDGFVMVALAWILMSLFGALPFVFDGAIPNFANAFFETVSGFTTTGATILTEIESLNRGILFWRSFTHWIGGMGVLVFMMAILPSAGGQNMHLMRAEVPGPTKGKLVPKMRHTALILYGIYFALTVIEFIALLCCKMPIYDAAVNSLATAGTGGFSVLNSSIGGYGNPAAEWVIAVFMFLFGVNFNLYFFILIGRVKEIFKNEEFRVYIGMCAVSTALIFINILNMAGSVGDQIRAAFFQVTSIVSTTGFTTVNYVSDWPEFSKTLLVLLTLIGGCAGSTAGGLKLSRVIIVFKGILCRIKKILRPQSVNVVKIDGEAVPNDTVNSAMGYMSIYWLLIVVVTLIVSLDGFDFATNSTAVLTCINNVGPGLGEVASNFALFSDGIKVVFSFLMLIGRLEIMPMLIFFSPIAWKKR